MRSLTFAQPFICYCCARRRSWYGLSSWTDSFRCLGLTNILSLCFNVKFDVTSFLGENYYNSSVIWADDEKLLGDFKYLQFQSCGKKPQGQMARLSLLQTCLNYQLISFLGLPAELIVAIAPVLSETCPRATPFPTALYFISGASWLLIYIQSYLFNLIWCDPLF